MPDTTPNPPLPTPPGSPATATATPSELITEFNIGDEFGTAKRNLPPARIVLICLVAVAIVIAIFAFRGRPKPQGGGSIALVSAVEVPEQHMVLAAITFTLRNTAPGALWIHTLKAELKTADGHSYDDDAASAVDLDRYYQLFPALKEGSEPPLSPEIKLPAGTEKKGTIVVSFPVTKDAFDQRTSLDVSIQPYDQALPVVVK